MPSPKASIPKTPLGQRLSFLVGVWAMELKFPATSDTPIRGTASFRWLAKDNLLLMFSQFDKGGPPTSTSVIGGDDSTKDFFMLYSDERGVARHMTMTLTPKTWIVRRTAPGFSQKFIGKVEATNRIIRRGWQKSFDGVHWEPDFDLIYTKRSASP